MRVTEISKRTTYNQNTKNLWLQYSLASGICATYKARLRRGRRITTTSKLPYKEHTGLRFTDTCERNDQLWPFADRGWFLWQGRRPEPNTHIQDLHRAWRVRVCMIAGTVWSYLLSLATSMFMKTSVLALLLPTFVALYSHCVATDVFSMTITMLLKTFVSVWCYYYEPM